MNRTSVTTGLFVAALFQTVASAAVITTTPAFPPTPVEPTQPTWVDYPVSFPGPGGTTYDLSNLQFIDVGGPGASLPSAGESVEMAPRPTLGLFVWRIDETGEHPYSDGLDMMFNVHGLGGSAFVANYSFDVHDFSFHAGPPGALIRESPTLVSLGQMSVTDIGGGLYRVDSFFDVFLELSLDGGQSWVPANSPMHMELFPGPVPAPGAAALLGVGGLLATRRRRAPVA